MIDGIEFNPYFLGELVPYHACVFSCGVDAVQNGVTPLTGEKRRKEAGSSVRPRQILPGAGPIASVASRKRLGCRIDFKV